MKKILLFILIFTCLCAQANEHTDSFFVNKVNFQVNTAVFVEDDEYVYYKEKILPYIEENSERIEKIILTGYASPEGNPIWNRRLSDERIEKIASDINIKRGTIVRQSIGENYDDLYERISLSDEPYKDDVLHVLDNAKSKKIGLMKLNRGEVWKDILNKYFKDLRCVKIEIILKKETELSSIDTIYVERIDTVYISELVVQKDTVYIDRDRYPRLIPILAVKTNVVADLIPYSPFGISFTPNVQAELYTWVKGVSLEFAYTFPWWMTRYKCYQIMNGTAGIRKYFGKEYTGFYAGAYFSTGVYDFMKDGEHGWQGEANGVGMSFGYVFKTKFNRVKIEPYIRVGYLYGNFDTYHYGEDETERYYYNWYGRNSEFVRRRFSLDYVGPTALGINLTFDLICLRKY